MRLYLVRHSKPASPDGDDGSADYDETPDPDLDDEGREIAEAVGKWMAEHDEIPACIYASPMARTMQTAQCIADAIKEAGFVPPEIEVDASIGPDMSIKGAIETIADLDDDGAAMVVSHHESITHGLRVLNGDDAGSHDMFAQGELRILKVKRKSGKWSEKKRITPSDLGLFDHY